MVNLGSIPSCAQREFVGSECRYTQYEILHGGELGKIPRQLS